MLKTIVAAAAAVLFLTGASAPLPVLPTVPAATMTKLQDDECKIQCIARCHGDSFCIGECMDMVCPYEAPQIKARNES